MNAKHKKRPLPYIVIPCVMLLGFVAALFFFVFPTEQDDIDFQSAFFYSQTSVIIPYKSGLYYGNSTGFLRFYDYESGQDVLVCSKSNCKHERWTEDTPYERRCDAYLNTGSMGFIQKDRMYIIGMTSNINEMSITQSNIDRTEQIHLADFSSFIIDTFVVKGNILFLPAVVAVPELDDNGMPIGIDKGSAVLYAVDLNSGTVRELTDPQQNYNAMYRIVGVRDHIIYLLHGYFEEKFDGTNYNEAKFQSKMCSYNTETGEYNILPVDTGGSIVERLLNDSFISWKYEDSIEDLEIYEIDLFTNESVLIGTAQRFPRYIDNNIVFRGQAGYIIYNTLSGERQIIDDLAFDSFYILQDAGIYVFGSRSVPDNSPDEVVLIMKADFYNVIPNFIQLKYAYTS
jgi:hypothetical protein